jgi:hypothetical protein
VSLLGGFLGGSRVALGGHPTRCAKFFDDHDLARLPHHSAQTRPQDLVARFAEEEAWVLTRCLIVSEGEAERRQALGPPAFTDERDRCCVRLEPQHSLLDALIGIPEACLVLCDSPRHLVVHDACSCARIRRFGDLLRYANVLVHHHDVAQPLDNRLDVGDLMPGLDEEPIRLASDFLVLSSVDSEHRHAVVRAALAHDGNLRKLRPRLVEGIDLLVRLPEGGLVTNDSLHARGMRLLPGLGHAGLLPKVGALETAEGRLASFVCPALDAREGSRRPPQPQGEIRGSEPPAALWPGSTERKPGRVRDFPLPPHILAKQDAAELLEARMRVVERPDDRCAFRDLQREDLTLLPSAVSRQSASAESSTRRTRLGLQRLPRTRRAA